MMLVGIDPGYGRTGVAVLSAATTQGVHHLELIETSPALPHEQRLREVFENLTRIFTTFVPTHMAIERLFHGKNAKTVIGVAEARGVALLVAAQHGLKVLEFTPMQIKQSVAGFGGADKKQVAQMLALTLQLPTQIWIDDVTDALAVAFTGVVSGPLLEQMRESR